MLKSPRIYSTAMAKLSEFEIKLKKHTSYLQYDTAICRFVY